MLTFFGLELAPRCPINRFATQLTMVVQCTFETKGGKTHIGIIRLWQNTEDITIQWSVVFIERRLTPATRMEAPLCTANTMSVLSSNQQDGNIPLRNRCVKPRYPQRGITRRRTKALHADEPRWRGKRRDRQCFDKLGGEVSRSLVL